MAKPSDHYATLGVPQTATAAEIKRAYRRKAKEHHPDAGGKEDAFKAVSGAYDVLCDPEKRKAYDAERSMAGKGERQAPSGRSYPYRRTPSTQPAASSEVSDETFADLLGSMGFGQGMPGSWQDAWPGTKEPRKPSSGVRAEATLTFAQALEGTAMTLRDGTGVTLPPGTYDGLVLRFPGKARDADGQPADLQVTVRVKADPTWSRDAADLVVDLPVSVREATLGGEVTLRSPGGVTLKAKVPAGSRDGRRLRFRGKGARRLDGEGHGDLLATLRVAIPRNLDEESRKAYEGLPDDGTELRRHLR